MITEMNDILRMTYN